MEESRYGLRVILPLGYNEALERTVAALKQEGFGVLTSIDVKQTLKQKLDKEFRKYVILGAWKMQQGGETFSQVAQLLSLPWSFRAAHSRAATPTPGPAPL
jgi:uncharacterized protein (DUF302 family)